MDNSGMAKELALTAKMQTPCRASPSMAPKKLLNLLFVLILLNLIMVSASYRPGDVVPMSRMGQYHSMRTPWHDVLGHHCPIFAVNREVLLPIPKPTGYTGADPYKISFQVGREKYLIPWLLLLNRKGPEVPMIDVHLRFSGTDIHGVTAKVVNMPQQYATSHEKIRKEFWDPQHWPKHIIVRYFWEEVSEVDISAGFYTLFGSGFVLTLVLMIYILQSSKEKVARFVRENVVETSMGTEEAKVE
eukprot:TRINITY_DN9518_c0_g1_i1.p1 TRINITY_DN9518_c0_g1~~TRINITY_DN9518_c0_g1_i1.p1  ORF type:complete len:245 (+),score=32.10 TRINITY_DN9518_c0_g1_i1:52-786(+)